MKSDVQDKYFPHVTRIDDAYGDRNLVCKFSAELFFLMQKTQKSQIRRSQFWEM